MLTFEEIKNNPEIDVYIRTGNSVLGVIGYTEHSFAHAMRTAVTAGRILTDLGYDERQAELARIAGYMHDIGNVVNRIDHAQSGAVMAFRILDRLSMEPKELAEIVGAIGNHDEGTGTAVNITSAALILADKSDVRRSRVRNASRIINFDIHDRVNYAVTQADIAVSSDRQSVALDLSIDTSICAVMDYFEIFLSRMLMCRRACDFLGVKFQLEINGLKFL